MTGYGFTPETIQRIAGSLVHFIWQGAAVALAASLCLRLLRKRSAELRYSLSVGALAVMFAAPVLTFIFYVETGAAALKLFELTGNAVMNTAPAAWTQWILFGWLVGVLLFSARLITGWRLSDRLVDSATPLLSDSILYVFEDLRQRLELSRPIRLLMHTRIDTPMVVGCLKPAVLLPVSALTGLSEDHLTAILAHELAHVRRHDFFVNLLQRCVESLLFYHPGVWWLSARIRNEREHCCDDIAVRMCGDRKTYIRALVELERKRQVVPALGVAANGGSLTARVHRLLGLGTVGIDWQSAAATLVFALVLMIAAAWHSPDTLQAAPVLPPGLPAAAVIMPVTASPEPVAQAVNAIAAIITAQPPEVPQPEPPIAEQQNPDSLTASVVGVIQGVVTRAGTSEPIPDVQIALEGGSLDAKSMAQLVSTVANAGISITPPEGASLAEATQLIINAAAARGLPLQPAAIQNLVTRAAGPQTAPVVVTDRDGRFMFRELKPGRYTVRASKEGYFGKPVNAVYPPTVSVDVSVVNREPLQVSLSMSQGGIISGRIFDASGAAVSNVNVQAFSVGYQTGFSLLVPAASKTTDDRGEYRLFWIPPGDYYLGVTPRPALVADQALPSARTYFPATTKLSDALPITIRGGEDLSGMNIAIRTAPLFKISGTISSSVVSPPGLTGMTTAFLHLASRDMDTPSDGTTANAAGNTILMPDNTGAFEVTNVAPGTYELLARVADPSVGTGLAAFSWGRAIVEITDHDIRGLAIAVNASPALQGVVKPVNGVRLPPNLRIVLNPAGGPARVNLYTLIAARGTPVAADGTFSVSAVPPGQFRVNTVSGLPKDYYVADVLQNGVSVFDAGFEIDSKVPNPIEILISNNAGVVEGVVEDGSKPVAGAVVALAPEARRLDNRTLYATATTDASGRFTFDGVAPGDYQLLSWETTPANAYQSAVFIRQFAEKARPVHVTQGSTVTVPLKVIRK